MTSDGRGSNGRSGTTALALTGRGADLRRSTTIRCLRDPSAFVLTMMASYDTEPDSNFANASCRGMPNAVARSCTA